MKTLDDFDFKGKTVFVRVDLNSPVDEKTKKIEPSARIFAHAKTIKELSDKKAKVVVLAHQGRKGDSDFISLSQHSLVLGAACKKPVKFVDDVCSEKAKSAIASLCEGEILLLENTRFVDDETAYKTIEENEQATIVKELSSFCDIFVLDAFSVAHRPHASVVGFYRKPTAAGRILQQELDALSKLSKPKKPVAFIFGGAKVEDSIGILEHWLEKKKLDYALVGGVLGELFILASGVELGKTTDFLRESKALEYLPSARELLSKYKRKIFFPQDVALDANGKRKEIPLSKLPSDYLICDIGKKTARLYKKYILKSKTIVMNGPVGVYEKKAFSDGTKSVLAAIASSKGFSVLGGGHTLSAISKFRISRKKIGYISLAGKALIEYLSGQELPGIKILNHKANL
ncbi:MAG: phosphoglycerate kinase [Candidatus Micrarchaeota archaeon]|nr:phosphoglycerate kinase [Candidatus Micrarchaeota archaeon]